MSSNDFFSVAYKILSYLKDCYEKGVNNDPHILLTDCETEYFERWQDYDNR